MEIKPFENNAKLHTQEQLRLLARVVAEVGWRQNVEVNQQGVIVAGHGRYAAWQEHREEYNLPEVWVTDDTGKTIMGAHATFPLTEQQESMWRLADNQLNAMTGFDMKLVIPELKGLSEKMLELTGFSKDLILEDEDKDDEVPELQDATISKLGDIYQLGKHRVLCGDSTNLDEVSRLVGGVQADLYLTDPPYNVAYEGKTKDALTIQNDEMSDEKFKKFLVDAFTVADKVMKMGAVFYIWHADSEGYNFRGACKEIGWHIRQCIIWNKNSLVMGRQDYQWKHEPCLYGWKEGSSHNWYGDRDKTTIYKIPEDDRKALEWFKKQMKKQEESNTSVIDHKRPSRSSEHPTMKPVELLVKQIVNSSKEDDIILDTFLGSGSTLIASEKTGRICYGVELDPKYVDVIIQRYVNYVGNQTIIKNGEEIQWTLIQ